MKGFEGKLLIVNLTDKEISEEKIDDTIATNFIGGAGYACKYLYDKINKDTDPLSPDNILMFMTGLFCGSNAPTSGRFVVCAKSPQTGIWGESNCGGFFGPELRKVGYDGIVFKGSSESPVFLEIIDNKAELKDASDLWGKGIFETSKILKEKLGSQLTRIACIGQAGENLVKYAIIASEDKAAGRTGMGAVMGSKKLKAIAIRGTKRKYIAFEPEEFREAVKVTNEAINSAFATQMFGDLGTSSGVDMYNASGELPIKYWKQGTWEGAFNISGSTAFETMFTGSHPCFSCPIGCSKRVKIDEGEFKTDGEIQAAEYETVAGFGSMILNDNLGAIQRANYLCNDYGIDTISGSSTISFIYDLFDTGRITTEDLNGLEPKWGEITPALELLKKIALREGIGDAMAEGSDYVGKKFNIPQDDIATVYGMEIPYHDLRRMYGMAASYALATPRGPCHTSCDAYMVILGLPFSEFGIELNVDWYQDDKPMAEFCARIQNYRALYASLIICSFANPPSEMILEMLNKATGLNLTMENFKQLGERIYMIKRMFNLKMGLTPADDRLPKIALNPVNEGGSAGKTPNFQQLKNAYYDFRQFDKESGYPSQNKLKELGLDDL
ncbi:MAG: aldehyde ferredoxin oxidoreductase family protein [Candidatus Lokiarchaeota archaeon]|nr:aldehyde ferredoxin oxidoreductase family protein [Candidatus Lokiarchaeota archaeon]